MSGNKGENAAGDDMFGPEPWTRWYRRHTKAVFICLLVLVAGIAAWYFWPNGHSGDAATNEAAQQTLQSSLQPALDHADDEEIVDITSQLIAGANSGTYHFDNETLAEYHLDRAASYINLKMYDKVASDSEAAANLSNTAKNAALGFEFEARYTLGERQQLIPLLNRLIQSEQASSNPMKSAAIAQYQQDISYIQQDREITF